MLHRVLGMLSGIHMVTVRQVCVVCGLFMVARLMVRGGLIVVTRSVLVVFRCLLVVVRCFF